MYWRSIILAIFCCSNDFLFPGNPPTQEVEAMALHATISWVKTLQLDNIIFN